jgi:hypothetical protein
MAKKKKKPLNMLYDPTIYQGRQGRQDQGSGASSSRRRRDKRQPSHRDIIECMGHGAWRRDRNGAVKQVRWEWTIAEVVNGCGEGKKSGQRQGF